MKEFNELNNESKAKVKFEEIRDKLSANNGDTLIIANKTINLNN